MRRGGKNLLIETGWCYRVYGEPPTPGHNVGRLVPRDGKKKIPPHWKRGGKWGKNAPSWKRGMEGFWPFNPGVRQRGEGGWSGEAKENAVLRSGTRGNSIKKGVKASSSGTETAKRRFVKKGKRGNTRRKNFVAALRLPMAKD